MVQSPAIKADQKRPRGETLARFGQRIAFLGFFFYAIFAPHSIAGSEIALGIATSGWLIRTLALRKTGFRRSKLDAPIWLFFLWTVLSAIFSAEPRVSLLKLQSVCVFLVFYLTQAILTRRAAVVLVSIMILSGVAGAIWSAGELIRGRGVVVQSIVNDSPFLKIRTEADQTGRAFQDDTTRLVPGDTVWRVGGTRVSSVSEIDETIRKAPSDKLLAISVISNGEHAEWPGITITSSIQQKPSPSGIVGGGASHRFRASGWTRHYEYFAEILQLLTQLALGLACAHFLNHGLNRRCKLATIAAAILAFGIAFTAMRTVLVAFAIAACFLAWRSARRSGTRVVVIAAIAFFLGFGGVVVWQTRAAHALQLDDASASLRAQVASVAFSRILHHPVFGHGMDAMHLHWTEWGFPGIRLVHMHSTPLQIAFDRGLPALFIWIWLVVVCWRMAARAERLTRDSGDTNRHGLLLGASGALTGFFLSSLVNYNFGAGIVALAFWWLMGMVLVLSEDTSRPESST